jgi:hypothetical protein
MALENQWKKQIKASHPQIKQEISVNNENNNDNHQEQIKPEKENSGNEGKDLKEEK